MKKSSLLLFSSMLLVVFGYACRFHHRDTSIKVVESDRVYSLQADFPESQTRRIQQYLDRCLYRNSNRSFVNTQIDGEMALDDHTRFYIRLHPGELKIKLNKNENSHQSYKNIKKMCEGIKEMIK